MTEATIPVFANARAETKDDPLAYAFEGEEKDLEFLLQEIEAQIRRAESPP
jgi:hypothetical protein